jgi:hypothetical protein
MTPAPLLRPQRHDGDGQEARRPARGRERHRRVEDLLGSFSGNTNKKPYMHGLRDDVCLAFPYTDDPIIRRSFRCIHQSNRQSLH